MAATQPLRRQIKLPRRYFKRVSPPPAFRDTPDRFVADLAVALNHNDARGAVRARSNLRKIMLQDIATAIVDEMRAAHINITMGNQRGVNNSTVPGWKQLRAQGHLDDEVAILVDGSPQRPIKNVSFGGVIQIMAPPSLDEIIDAAEFCWNWMVAAAASTKGPFSGDTRKKGKAGHYRYHRSFEMFVNGSKQVTGPADLRNPDVFKAGDFVVIHNYVPYAAKLERYRYPQSVFYQGWKRTRAKHGKKVAVRFDFVQSTDTTVRAQRSSVGFTPNAQPVILIGDPRAFGSSAPRMSKIVRNAKRREESKRSGTYYINDT